MLKNEISAVMAAQDIKDIIAAIDGAEAKLPGHVNLPPDLREAMLKINVANKDFVETAVKVYPNIKHLMAGYIDAVEMEKDLNLFNDLDKIRIRTQEFLNRLTDLMILTGNEAFIVSLAIYNGLEQPAKRGLQGAKEARDEMSPRFAGQGKRKKKA